MAPANASTHDARLTTVRQTLGELDVDALLVTTLPNVAYLTGFRGTAGVVLLTADQVQLVTDFRYVAAVDRLVDAGTAPSALEVVRVDVTYDETIVDRVRATGGRRVAFEARHVSVARHDWWRATLARDTAARQVELVPTERVVERARLRKDAHEVETLRVAARMLAEAAGLVLPRVRSGIAERNLAATIDRQLHDVGFERPAFDTIVASGPNAGLPHARPGGRHLATGDLVVLDFGGVYDGYCVDLTRMAAVGEPDPEARAWHAAVLEAQGAAIAAVRPGVEAASIDAAARGVLERAGMGEAFGHGTGHGLGLEVHEEPRVSRRRPEDAEPGAVSEDPTRQVIEPGMVFTVEPGVYFPGRGGVRIEDDVLVTGSGCEVLTDVARELVVTE